LAGKITDDYGIDRVWFECTVDQGKPVTVPLAALAKRPTEYSPPPEAALEARDLKVLRGQKLSLVVKAADACTLGQGPNIGSTETWGLDVVSPDELRTLLEARELVLRQRFEVIIQEVAQTRDLLLRMDFAPASAAKPAAKQVGGAAAKQVSPLPPGEAPASGHPGVRAAEKRPAAEPGAEPGDKPPVVPDLSPAELAARRTERVLQALQGCRKNAQETLEVAEAFDDIRQQLANNRIDTEELKERLGTGIAEPLHRIVTDMFSALERRLETLQAAVADLAAGPKRRDAAAQQADEILLAMHRVLKRMAELEDFDQVVQDLRALIEKQEQIIKRTKERQKQSVRDLMEE
jgi:hypothetical protein